MHAPGNNVQLTGESYNLYKESVAPFSWAIIDWDNYLFPGQCVPLGFRFRLLLRALSPTSSPSARHSARKWLANAESSATSKPSCYFSEPPQTQSRASEIEVDVTGAPVHRRGGKATRAAADDDDDDWLGMMGGADGEQMVAPVRRGWGSTTVAADLDEEASKAAGVEEQSAPQRSPGLEKLDSFRV